jgi:hypothetical protein
MIIDGSQSFPGVAGFLVAVPAAGTPNSSSIAVDLNPDFGTGASARKSPVFEQSGEDLVVVCEVILPFTVAAGTPVAQFHLAVSNATPGGLLLQAPAEFAVIGSNVGSHQLVGGRLMLGFVAAQLTLKNKFLIRANPWTAPMGRTLAGATLKRRDLRSFGVVMVVPNYDQGGATTAFSAGAIQCYVAKAGDVFANPSDFIYPAAQVHV